MDYDDDVVILLFTYFDFPRTRSCIPISRIQYSVRPTRIHASRRFRGTHPPMLDEGYCITCVCNLLSFVS
jgi:hypothetical protein